MENKQFRLGYKRQRGFSFLEVIITIGLVTLLYGVMMEGFAPAIQFRAKIETEARLKSLRTSVLAAYKDNMASVDADTGQKLVFTVGSEITQQLPNADNRCVAPNTTFLPIARYLDTASTNAHLDGYNRSLCVYITPRQSVVIDGITLNYHSVALVATAQNGRIDAGTTLSATGELTLAGDDIGVLLDGRSFVQTQFQSTLDALRRTSDAYQAYFQARYQADSDRSISIDYFSCGVADCATAVDAHWDVDGAMPVSGSAGDGAAMNTVTASGRPYEILGLSQSDVTDGYGQVLLMQNRGDICRNPSNSTTALKTPPYTAVIYTTLPGGARLSQTVVGIF
ncbi:MAG: hypothetical protein A2514_14445 [Gammaproteobacteria bacterium RIFOXYD12_FULL_61_37]|nr:MAG: hypothetical protein A2514_14445 [Gammaproteobacteria bacterium RIFOXYD12_FULL_61_37]